MTQAATIPSGSQAESLAARSGDAASPGRNLIGLTREEQRDKVKKRQRFAERALTDFAAWRDEHALVGVTA